MKDWHASLLTRALCNVFIWEGEFKRLEDGDGPATALTVGRGLPLSQFPMALLNGCVDPLISSNR